MIINNFLGTMAVRKSSSYSHLSYLNVEAPLHCTAIHAGLKHRTFLLYILFLLPRKTALANQKRQNVLAWFVGVKLGAFRFLPG